MKKIFLFILSAACCILHYAHAQTWQWARNPLSVIGGDNEGYRIKIGAKNNIYVLGRFIDSSLVFGSDTLHWHTGGDWYIAKYDASGNALFGKSLGKGYFEAFGLDVDANDNCYVTGWFSGDSATVGTTTIHNPMLSFQKMFITKIDSAGNFIWVKSNSGTTECEPFSLTVDAANNIYVYGDYYGDSISFDSITLYNTYTNLFIGKFDSSGNTLWLKSTVGTGVQPFDIACDPLGNLFITGRLFGALIQFDTITVTNNTSMFGGYRAFIAKYDSSGHALWAKTENQNGPAGNEGRSLSTDNLGNVYLTGHHYDEAIFDSDTLVGQGSYIAKFNTNGNLLWIRNIRATSTGTCITYGIAVDDFGNGYVTGYFDNDSIVADNIILHNSTSTIMPNGNCIFLIKYDSQGNAQWAQKGIGIANATDVSASPTNDIYITGTFSHGTLYFDSILISGHGYNYTTFIAKLGSPTTKENSLECSISIFPNPFDNKATVKFSYTVNAATLRMYNMYGQIVLERNNISGEETNINAENLRSGVYVYEVTDKEKKICTGKAVVY